MGAALRALRGAGIRAHLEVCTGVDCSDGASRRHTFRIRGTGASELTPSLLKPHRRDPPGGWARRNAMHKTEGRHRSLVGIAYLPVAGSTRNSPLRVAKRSPPSTRPIAHCL